MHQLGLESRLDGRSRLWPRWTTWASARLHIVCKVCPMRPQLSPQTTSAGRLFDAAAAIILGLTHARIRRPGRDAARRPPPTGRCRGTLPQLPMGDGDRTCPSWIGGRWFAQLLADKRRGVEAGPLAMRFHRSLARAIVRVCRRRAELPVVLTGGVFQNRLLTELVVELGDECRQPLGLPGMDSAQRWRLGRRTIGVARPREAVAMCLAVPGRIVQLARTRAAVRFGDRRVRRRASEP